MTTTGKEAMTITLHGSALILAIAYLALVGLIVAAWILALRKSLR